VRGAKEGKAGGEGPKVYDAQQRIRDALEDAGLPFVAALPGRVESGWHVVTRPDGLIVRLDPRGAGVTPAQQTTADALVLGLDLTTTGLASAEVLALRAAAKTLFDDLQTEGKALRALAWLLLNQVNALRARDAAWQAATAAATTLADFKARVAALPPLPAIPLKAAWQAYRDLLDAGTADAPPP
jgi:hypothetical protein